MEQSFDRLAKTINRIRETPLKTIRDELQRTREVELREPKPKKRKTDRRTLRKRARLAQRVYRREKADTWREAQGTLKDQFYKLRREVRRRGRKDTRADSKADWTWELKMNEWINMWGSCPAVEVGLVWKPAWLCRGRDRGKDVQLKRKDVNLPWRLDNLLIIKGKQVLYDAGTDT